MHLSKWWVSLTSAWRHCLPNHTPPECKAIYCKSAMSQHKLVPHSNAGDGHRPQTGHWVLSLSSKVLNGRKYLFKEQTHNTAGDEEETDERVLRVDWKCWGTSKWKKGDEVPFTKEWDESSTFPDSLRPGRVRTTWSFSNLNEDKIQRLNIVIFLSNLFLNICLAERIHLKMYWWAEISTEVHLLYNQSAKKNKVWSKA